MTYHLVPVEDLDPEAIGLVREIYEAGFPVSERAGFESLTDQREPGEFGLALIGGSGPCGFAMLRPLGPTGWIFLRYFVVAAAQRGHGLGGVLWEHLTSRLAEAGYSLLVFDVEDPDEAGSTAEEVLTRRRRIAFYRRHDASLLPVTGYRMPGLDAEEPGWLPMLLMAASLAAGSPQPSVQSDLSAVVGAVYRYRWGLSPDHPQVTGTRLAYSDGRPEPAE